MVGKKRKRQQFSDDGTRALSSVGFEAPIPVPAVGSEKALQELEVSVPLEWRVGDVILDLYEVKDIYEGGMGRVYRVYHRGWNVDLAVKSPKPGYFQTDLQKDDFTRECETWINLGLHPHIVSCHYVRNLGGIPRMFAEYVEGRNLKEWIHSGKLYEGGPQAALQRILDIATQMAWGLHYAHEKGVIHQDVKPGNVMMTPDGTAKLTDFGLARARAAANEVLPEHPTKSIRVTYGGMTPAYCSPEQAEARAEKDAGIPPENRTKLTRATDVWSWAVTVFEMFYGEPPRHGGQSAGEVFEAYVAKGYRDEESRVMPLQLAEILLRCFRHDVAARPNRIEDVADECVNVYQTLIPSDYARSKPRTLALQPDGLNNRALSFLDLGKPNEAETAWRQALEVDPLHSESMNNLALLKSPRLLRTVEAHRGAVCSVVLTSDNLRALSGGDDGILMVWDLSSGSCTRSFRGHAGRVNSVCLSSDSRHALSGGDDGKLMFWDLCAGRCRTIAKSLGSIQSVALSNDTTLVAAGSMDGTIYFGDRRKGVLAAGSHLAAITSVCVSSDCRHVLSGSYDGTIKLWEFSSNRCLQTYQEAFPDLEMRIESLSLSSDARYALCGDVSGELIFWDVGSGRCIRRFRGHEGAVLSVCLSSDGRYAISGGEDNSLRLWATGNGLCLRSFNGHGDRIHSAFLGQDSVHALTGNSDGTLELWAVMNERPSNATFVFSTPGVVNESASSQFQKELEAARLEVARRRFNRALAPLRRARRLRGCQKRREAMEVWASMYHHLPRRTFAGIWNIRSLPGHEDSLFSVAVTGDGKYAVSGSWDGARLWELSTGRCAGIVGDEIPVSTSADDRWALVVCGGKARKLEVETLRCIWEDYVYPPASACLSWDGRFAVAADGANIGRGFGNEEGENGFCQVWDTVAGIKIWEFDGEHKGMFSVAFSPDSRYVVTAGKDGTLKFWELSSARCLHTFESHTTATSVCLSSDGRYACFGSPDGTLRLWELSSGRCLRRFDGHGGLVTSVSISLDGRYVLSGSLDERMRLWDVSSGNCLRVFGQHAGRVYSVCLSADARYALFGGDDKALHVCALEWGLEERAPAKWDEDARAYLQTFLSQHVPYCPCPEADAHVREINLPLAEDQLPLLLTRGGQPAWDGHDFKSLMRTLRYAGYGWLRPEGVRRELEKMARDWDGPPPAPWERA